MSYSPIPEHPGTLFPPPVAAEPPRRRIAVLPTLATVLVVLLTAAIAIPIARSATAPAGLADYLPAQPTESLMADALGGGTWQTGQAVVGGHGLIELSAPIREAIGPVDTTRSRWLLLDGMSPDRNGGFATVIFRVGAEITWDGFESNQGWAAFRPGLPALTEDLLAGRSARWSGTISRAGVEPTSADAEISLEPDPEPGCVATQAAIRLSSGGVPSLTYRSRWCSGAEAGVAGWSAGVTSPAIGFERRPGVAAPAERYDLAAPAPPGLRGTQVDQVRFFRQLGRNLQQYEILTGSFVARAGATVAIADSEGTVTGWQPLTRAEAGYADYGVLWRARPGGSVRGLVSVGDLTVVGTTSRRIVAYQPTGAVLWSRQVDDAVTAVVAGDAAVVVTVANGDLLTLDPRSGESRWQHRTSPLDRAPVVGGDTVAVVTADGVEIRDLGDGTLRWSAASERRVTEVAVADGLVAIRHGGWLIARDAETGRVRWDRAVSPNALLAGAPTSVTAFASAGTESYDLNGRRRWTAPAASAADGAGTTTVLSLADRLEARGDDGTVTTWPWPAGYAEPSTQPAIVSGGVLTLHRSTTRTTWWQYR